ncbi:hypothetical protein CERSUDRAFT_94394 [Gelatoporia subvermispora B]|uniref:GLTSCR protein conserved domain-containing protein n=1 Tax=Ceriporiopsis subvermispora (strain B) TaxID=914234 RepID=M2RG01_CERS8|nr:hypothetical protein CERSUDRAFT_94394 [Gelatoporia subvermispora B]
MSKIPNSPFTPSTSFQSPVLADSESAADIKTNGSAAVTPAPATPATQAASIGPELTTPAQSAAIEQRSARPTNAADIEAAAVRARKLAAAKGRSAEETGIMLQTATRFAARLSQDHTAVLQPDVDLPFVDAEDAVKRLLPYHVFQQPKDDLRTHLDSFSTSATRKGKRKATEEELLREEIAETKLALECWRRRKALEDRFKRTRIRSGTRPCFDDQAYALSSAILESERTESTMLNTELRNARSELDKLEREKKASAPPPTPSTPATPARPTPPAYYAQPAAPASAYSGAYRGYAYPYGTYGTSQYTYNPAHYDPNTAYASTSYATSAHPNPYAATAYPSVTPTQPYPIPAAAQTAAAGTASTAATTSVQAQQTPQTPVQSSHPITPVARTSAIPVQLPATSMSALAALGITPVPTASLPPPDKPQPAAVLKGTSHNGTILNLEINVGSLQQAQMSGLALVLNALTARGVTVDGTAASTPTSGAATSPPSSTNVASVAGTPPASSSNGTGTGTATNSTSSTTRTPAGTSAASTNS